jgi:ribonuclease HI
LLPHRAARNVKPEALAAITNLQLPSYHWKLLQVSETFIRLNTDEHRSWSTRARWLAIVPHQQQRQRSNRLVLAQSTTNSIGWKLEPVNTRRTWPICSNLPPAATPHYFWVDGVKYTSIQSFCGVWGVDRRPYPDITVFTDASYQPAVDSNSPSSSSSSWAVCMADDWLLSNHRSVEPEGKISKHTFLHTASLSDKIDTHVSTGIYDAELQAIARAIMALPLPCNITIHTDSQSAVKAIHSYSQATNDRRQLRMSGRPLLYLIHRLVSNKWNAGYRVDIQWVKAHTTDTDLVSVGNRLADHAAVHVCEQRDSSHSLDLALYEPFACLRDTNHDNRVITGDPRGAARQRLSAMVLEEWRLSKSQCMYALDTIGYHELWQHACNHCPQLCGFVILLLSDTLQWCRVSAPHKVEEMRCGECALPCTANHLIVCPRLADIRRDTVNSLCRLLQRDAYQDRSHNIRWFAVDIMCTPGRGCPLITFLIRLGVVATPTDPLPLIMAACFGAFKDSRLADAFRSRFGMDRDIPTLIRHFRHVLLMYAYRRHRFLTRNPTP